jgi:uncharacterized protein (DUF488 family)
MPSNQIKLFTIGFTKKSAEQFFEILKKSNIKTVIDTRLNNVSQLAGFAKKNDLKYFLKEFGGIDYVHLLDLAPTKEILDEYKKHRGQWSVYEQKFLKLISERQIENKVTPNLIDHGCLLCSESLPHNCHRSLVANYLKGKWYDISIQHL